VLSALERSELRPNEVGAFVHGSTVVINAVTERRDAGMLVGAPWEVEVAEGGPGTHRELVLEVLSERDIPVLGNVDIGHDPPNAPMPLGVRAEVNADAATMSLLARSKHGECDRWHDRADLAAAVP
jgi:hypothetical protein